MRGREIKDKTDSRGKKWEIMGWEGKNEAQLKSWCLSGGSQVWLVRRQRKRRKLGRERQRRREREGGRDEELLLLLSRGLKKEEGCVHYRRDCSPGAVGDQTVTTSHLCMSVCECVCVVFKVNTNTYAICQCVHSNRHTHFNACDHTNVQPHYIRSKTAHAHKDTQFTCVQTHIRIEMRTHVWYMH